MRFFSFIAFGALLFIPALSPAQELHNDLQGTYRGTIERVLEERTETLPGTETTYIYQKMEAILNEGPNKGEVVIVENDYLDLEAGDDVYINHLIFIDGVERYTVLNVDRRDPLIVLVLLFVLAVIAFGGWQGVRSLVALGGSFLIIFYVLIPGLLAGWNPIIASFLVAAGVLFAAIFFTHGFNRESAVAYGGTMLSVLITSIFAIIAVSMTSLSGFASDETVYLNLNTQGSLDFTALLLGAIIIGVLGVLDDIAVTQAAVVSELYNSNDTLSKREVYKRALRVGREHVGALVNTLVLAYTGAALPLLLLFYLSPATPGSIINMEVFATEIVRMIVGSIGLILTVPIVTLLAVLFLKGYVPKHHSHSHSHGHHHQA